MRRRTGEEPLTAFVLVLALGLFGCAGRSAPPTPPAEPLPSPEPSVVPDRVEVVPPAPTASAETRVPTPEPAKPTARERIRTLCAEGCAKMEARCKEATVDVCRANCENFESDGETCPVEVEDALACQSEADDVIPCSNTAAESCVVPYRAMRECTTGRVPPKKERTAERQESQEEIPAGFERTSEARLGLSLLFPTPVTRASGDEPLRLSATLGEFEFRAEALPLVLPHPTDKTILKTALDFVGFSCQPKLRLHGRFESESIIHVRFDTACKDGVEWHGAFHFLDERVVVAAVRTKSKPASPIPHFEEFLFSVRRAGN